MKFGVNTMVWTTQVGEKQDPLFANLPAIKATLDRLQLERTTCTVLPRDANLVSYDAATRASGVDYLKKCVDRTAELGARLLCGPLHSES